MRRGRYESISEMSNPAAPGAHDPLGKIPGPVWLQVRFVVSLTDDFCAEHLDGKSRIIRDALRLRDHDPDLCRRELLADRPWAWFVEIDGLIVDARQLPAYVRDAACRKGLIPDPALLGETDR